jgi:hypothetical protein
MIATEVKKTFRACGTLDPNSDNTPSANAISVAAERPSPPILRRLPIDREEDEGRDHHASDRGGERKPAALPTVEFAGQELALDLEPDQQKKERHQPVIDPMQHIKAGHFGVEQRTVAAGERRIGDDEADRSTRHERQSAGGLDSVKRWNVERARRIMA